jgi:hypothetical protein
MTPPLDATTDQDTLLAKQLGEFSSFLVAERPAETAAREKLDFLAQNLSASDSQSLFRSLAEESLQFDLQLRRVMAAPPMIVPSTDPLPAPKPSRPGIGFPWRIAVASALMLTIGTSIFFVQQTDKRQTQLATVTADLDSQAGVVQTALADAKSEKENRIRDQKNHRDEMALAAQKYDAEAAATNKLHEDNLNAAVQRALLAATMRHAKELEAAQAAKTKSESDLKTARLGQDKADQALMKLKTEREAELAQQKKQIDEKWAETFEDQKKQMNAMSTEKLNGEMKKANAKWEEKTKKERATLAHDFLYMAKHPEFNFRDLEGADAVRAGLIECGEKWKDSEIGKAALKLSDKFDSKPFNPFDPSRTLPKDRPDKPLEQPGKPADKPVEAPKIK